jgi:hypothetical protein
MVVSKTFLNFKKIKGLADWKLLLFLVLFLNVKLAVKVPAILLVYLLQFNFKFGFSLKNSRLPLFYLLAMAIAMLNWILSRNYLDANYNIVLLTGIGFWILCILAMHQVKLFVDQNDTDTIHRTIVIFFILNAALSLCDLAAIVIETGAINPYTYQGQYQKYFIGTGDYVRGLTFDTSTTNAVLNALGVIYFLNKKNAAMLLVCVVILLLTGSNYTNIVLLACFVLLFLFKSSRVQKSLIAVCIMLLVVFMVKTSPQNYMYVHETIKNAIKPVRIHPAAAPANFTPSKPGPRLPITLTPDNQLNAEQKKLKTAQRHIDSIYVVMNPVHASRGPQPEKTETGRPIIPKPDINSRPFQHIADTNDYQRRLLAFIGMHKTELPLSAQVNYSPRLPGKVISGEQTLQYFARHPFKLLLGAGIGNFSSKLAFRASGLGFAGGYPKKYVYLSPDFLSNHLDVYLNFFSKKTDYHSLSNNPDSVYDQLLAEYGLLGLTALLVWYLGYFLKHYKVLTYGLPMLLIVLAMFFIEYWFEQLSILVFFELLLLLNIKEKTTRLATNDAI